MSGLLHTERLREIAFRAKAYWGYEEARVRAWADAIDFDDGRILLVEDEGWASVVPHGETCVLEDLWVLPEAMGNRVGSRLFGRAVERARELGASTLEWEAEPNAVGFYEKRGGHLRDSEPSEWGRVLPVMGVSLGE